MKKLFFLLFMLLPSIGFFMKADLEATETLSFVPIISPVKDQPLATDAALMHSLILLSDKVVANIFLREKSLNYDSLMDYLGENKSELNKKTLSIAVSKSADYMNVIKVVDMMANAGITNYQLVRYD